MIILPNRPAVWGEEDWPRVCFIGHALLSDDLSTELIRRRLNEVGGRLYARRETPAECIRWMSFPFVPDPSSPGYAMGTPVWVDVYVIPMLGADFFTATCRDNPAAGWVDGIARMSIEEAARAGVRLTIGWGAFTKLAMRHGALFAEKHFPPPAGVGTTHGDSGTAALAVDMLRRAGVPRGATAAVIGANGVTGDAVARELAASCSLSMGKVVLVGRPDRSGEDKNFERLAGLRHRMYDLMTHTESPVVVISQNKETACLDHSANVVIVATSGDATVKPDEIPEGALALDFTTPAACAPGCSWDGKMVLSAGCGAMPRSSLPRGFGSIGGAELLDIGAGGDRALWGCLCETIVRASVGWHGHHVELPIPLSELRWCAEKFSAFGIEPQTPRSFGEARTWSEVRKFCGRMTPQG